MLREFGNKFEYVSFDDPIEREFARTDPNRFLDRFKDRPVIFDEIQYLPEIFSYIKVHIDRNREKNGRWLFAGSQQFHLMKNISESLVGRIAILELLPFSMLDSSSTVLCFFLLPYFKNYGKRITKTPKLFFLDSAIVCELTRQPDKDSALKGPMAGVLFEGFVIGEVIKVFAIAGKRREIYFWRSHDGLEVDLIVLLKGKLLPVEIKLTATPSTGHLNSIQKFKALAGKDSSESGILVCCVKDKVILPFNNIAIPWYKFPEWLKDQIL